MKGHCILSHGFVSGPDATKVTALAEVAERLDRSDIVVEASARLVTGAVDNQEADGGRPRYGHRRAGQSGQVLPQRFQLQDVRECDPQLAGLKVPPHSIEAEQSVLGGLMLDNERWDDVAERVVADDFYTRPHRHIFTEMARLQESGSPIDLTESV